jgi:hypothetical protein
MERKLALLTSYLAGHKKELLLGIYPIIPEKPGVSGFPLQAEHKLVIRGIKEQLDNSLEILASKTVEDPLSCREIGVELRDKYGGVTHSAAGIDGVFEQVMFKETEVNRILQEYFLQ